MSDPNNTPITFLTFPLEIREMIYHHALRRDAPIVLRHYPSPDSQFRIPSSLHNRTQQLTPLTSEEEDADLGNLLYISDPLVTALVSLSNTSALTPSSSSPTQHTALLRANRQIHAEALPSLYRANRLVVDDPWHGRAWLAEHHALACAHLRHITVWVPRGLGSEVEWHSCVNMLRGSDDEEQRRVAVRICVQTPTADARPGVAGNGVVEWRLAAGFWANVVGSLGLWARGVEFGFFDEFWSAVEGAE
ncbi:hypothetical protein F4810DRAFT_411020 [Camillea tinctor]|nr:hypothetical protein F4810DRAFT_411020 [Camillea tinctor]